MTKSETEVLKLLREHLITAETRLFEHVATTFRWLMATLFAANGGAIVALVGATGSTLTAHYVTLTWFTAGLVLSIFMGILSGFWGHRASVRITTARFKIEQSLIDGTIDDEILLAIQAERPTWKTWVPSYAGIASFICLMIGIASVARGL